MSSESVYPHLDEDDTKLVPRVDAGELAVRSVSQLEKLEELMVCAQCNTPFMVGDAICQDVYLQDGVGATALKCDNESQYFRKSKLVLFHAQGRCPKEYSRVVTKWILQRIMFPQSFGSTLSWEEQVKRFQWCKKWIAHHDQYLFLPDDHVRMVVPSQQPTMVVSVNSKKPQSFQLQIEKQGPESCLDQVLIPELLLDDELMLQSLFTRIYVFDLIYTGASQPMLLLYETFKDQHESFCTDITMFAHIVPNADEGYHYGSNGSAPSIKLRLVVQSALPLQLVKEWRQTVLSPMAELGPLAWPHLSNELNISNSPAHPRIGISSTKHEIRLS